MAGTALVKGGAGFIGSHLAELLLNEGWEVYALDDLGGQSLPNLPKSLLSSLGRVGAVATRRERARAQGRRCHPPRGCGRRAADRRAARAHAPHKRPRHRECSRVRGTLRKAGPDRVQLGVYGDHPGEDLPLREDARRIYGPTTAKRWAYADSKAMDEFLALAHHEEEGLRCVIARLFNTVGPRQSGQYGNLIPRFVHAALTGEPLEVHGDGSQTRCFCHVLDTVRGSPP